MILKLLLVWLALSITLSPILGWWLRRVSERYPSPSEG